MQAEESASSRGRAESARSSTRLSPIKGFALVLILLAAAGGIFLLTRPPELPPTNINPQPADYSLTDAEAITRFHELKRLRDQVYLTRDPSLVGLIYTTDSPQYKSVLSEVRTLARQDVFDKTRFDTQRVVVRSNTSKEIEVLQEVVVHPRFVTESGKDVTASGRVERQNVIWTLRWEQDGWLVYNTVIVEAEPVKK